MEIFEIEKIQNNHDFANTNRDDIIKAIARVQKPILDDRDRIEKELWNKSLYWKALSVVSTVWQAFQDNNYGGRLWPSDKIADALRAVPYKTN